MQIATIAGNLGKDAETKTTQQGDKLCRFSVAVTTGWGDRKATVWWDVTIWGQRGEKLAPHLTKGSKVTVSGEISTREHEGKTYLQLRADHVTLQGDTGNHGARQSRDDRTYGQDTRTAAQARQETRQAAFAGGDLDDDVPF